MTRHIRDLSVARPRGCASIHSIKSILPRCSPEQIKLFQKLVSAQEGEVFTTSRKVAELFGKEHHNVLKAIDRLSCSAQFKAANFNFADFIDKNGDPRRECLMTKNGMVFLVMGFTGKQAAYFKELYIQAFDWTLDQLYEKLEVQHLHHDFTRRSAISVSNGTFHGQGLARRRIEKRALSQEHVQLQARSQLTLELTGEDAA
ncbi:MAG: Rha family transcriptional regulator [Aeromonas sobria]|uniref:Rha family transcriptional regulator n=1 Tax=Aeromonas sobria TaxID=646 RepID=UPI003F2E3242